jgi:hypothetical protein
MCVGSRWNHGSDGRPHATLQMTPEEKARQRIDAMLMASGWVVQTKGQINLSAGRGVAICELSFKTGEPDYTLFVDGKAIGTVEAKPESPCAASRRSPTCSGVNTSFSVSASSRNDSTPAHGFMVMYPRERAVAGPFPNGSATEVRADALCVNTSDPFPISPETPVKKSQAMIPEAPVKKPRESLQKLMRFGGAAQPGPALRRAAAPSSRAPAPRPSRPRRLGPPVPRFRCSGRRASGLR